MAYHQPFQITGFHSCDKEVGMDVLNGRCALNSSVNPWDWLGRGAYFWGNNPQRALSYAIDCLAGKQKFAGNIKTPFVIGANIELGNCLNLLEPTSVAILKNAYNSMKELFDLLGVDMNVNKGPNRLLDCAVIQYIHESNKQSGIPPYDTIRSSFNEGGSVYPTSNFTNRLHIEICVINPNQIKGYFLPRPVYEFNPYL